MTFKYRRLAYSLGLAGLLTACGGGGGDDTAANNNPPAEPSPAKTSIYAGSVRNSQGAPAAGLPIVLENRTTDQVYETTTDANGGFSATVEPGVYDVVFKEVTATGSRSLKIATVDLKNDRRDEVKMPALGSIAPNILTGNVKNFFDVFRKRQELLILPSVARSRAAVGEAEVPDPFIVTTDEQGNFSTSLGKPDMDIDFDVLLLAPDAPPLEIKKMAKNYQFSSDQEEENFAKQLDSYLGTYVQESLDVEKPSGAMHAELVFGSDTRNLRGATGAPSVVPSDAQRLVDYEKSLDNAAPATVASAWTRMKTNAANALLSVIPSAYAGEMLAKFLLISGETDGQGQMKSGTLAGGKINPSTAGCKYNSFLEMNNGVQPFNKESTVSASRTKFCVTKEKSLWIYNYKINLLTNKKGDFLFTDEVNDTYALRVINTYFSHNLRYNSSNPTIVDVEYRTN